ncbi:hypothetical protein ACWCYR_33300, partial [Streptomyces sp. NPDC001494]
MTPGEPRPGDAAREALRAARRRTGTAGNGTAPDPENPPATTAPEPGTESGAEPAGTAEPRPADIARAALRAATSAPAPADTQRPAAEARPGPATGASSPPGRSSDDPRSGSEAGSSQHLDAPVHSRVLLTVHRHHLKLDLA